MSKWKQLPLWTDEELAHVQKSVPQISMPITLIGNRRALEQGAEVVKKLARCTDDTDIQRILKKGYITKIRLTDFENIYMPFDEAVLDYVFCVLLTKDNNPAHTRENTDEDTQKDTHVYISVRYRKKIKEKAWKFTFLGAEIYTLKDKEHVHAGEGFHPYTEQLVDSAYYDLIGKF